MVHEINKHSAGPWNIGHLGDDTIDCECAYIFSEDSYMGGIATIHVDNGISSISEGGNDCPPREEAIANMHLIGTAPDLLDSVDMVYSLIQDLKILHQENDNGNFYGMLAYIEANLNWVRNKARNIK